MGIRTLKTDSERKSEDKNLGEELPSMRYRVK